MWRFPCWEAGQCRRSSAAGQARCCTLLSLQAAAKPCTAKPSIKTVLPSEAQKSITFEAHRLVQPVLKDMPKYSRQDNIWHFSLSTEECSWLAPSHALHIQCQGVQCTSCCQLHSALNGSEGRGWLSWKVLYLNIYYSKTFPFLS